MDRSQKSTPLVLQIDSGLELASESEDLVQ